MNAQQRKRLLAGRACACISLEHCCETLVQFRQRVPRTIQDVVLTPIPHRDGGPR